ncbi:porin family protein [Robertkochia solimangrovi]|uniref:porin family protein n=1 Tax=Robertkochia solimangrovi TaxID=2213046 RepID=UPI00117CECC7|nr:porin family protein [Robertkochia solimangrovi]TRZ41577.1 hypothetical protein DMZ48_16320 [Robertkochia solimangrovi]
MRKAIVLVFLLAGLTTFAQSGSGFGIKGGLNFNSGGDLNINNIEDNVNADGQVGYHLGIFYKFGGESLFYLRPELMYTKIKSKYEYNTVKRDFDMSKIDLPVLVGINILGPIHAFAGPSFQYILDTDFDDISIGDVENDFTIGLQLGAGVNLGALGIDFRYERGLSDNEVEFTGLNDGRVDTRPSQFILGLSYRL